MLNLSVLYGLISKMNLVVKENEELIAIMSKSIETARKNKLVEKSIDLQCDFLADEVFGLLAMHATNMEDFKLNKLYVDGDGNLYVKALE